MTAPFRDRPYQLFVSYAHEDRGFVSELVEWLAGVAGVRVWWDEERLPVSALVSYFPLKKSPVA
jgi:hypothetical protein